MFWQRKAKKSCLPLKCFLTCYCLESIAEWKWTLKKMMFLMLFTVLNWIPVVDLTPVVDPNQCNSHSGSFWNQKSNSSKKRNYNTSTRWGWWLVNRLGWLRFGEFPRLVGRYCSYLRPKQDGAWKQVPNQSQPNPVTYHHPHPVQGDTCPCRLSFVDLDCGCSTTLLGQ